MSTRLRSPNYPSMPLNEAIDMVDKIFKAERTNAVDRNVAAQAMGYSGVSGRSAKVLSNLIQYGLLEKAGKNEVRVSRRAVEIMHPDTPESKAQSIRDAALEPDLFQRVSERFPDGRPSEAALRSYFTKEEFTDAAIPPAIRAYMETFQLLEDVNVNGSYGGRGGGDVESVFNQSLNKDTSMLSSSVQKKAVSDPRPLHIQSRVQEDAESDPQFAWANKKIRLLGGVVSTKQQADEMISFIQAVRGMLADAPNDDSILNSQRADFDGPESK